MGLFRRNKNTNRPVIRQIIDSIEIISNNLDWKASTIADLY